MKYSKGDILVCSNDNLYGQRYQLVVGDKYQIINVIEISEDKTIIEALHVKTNRNIGLVSDKHFIPLQSYREWKILQIISD